MSYVNKLIETARKFQIDSDFHRIKNGKKLDLTKRPYTTKSINNMISFYENKEEYEKCTILLKFKNEILNHESNYKRSSIVYK